MYKTDKQGFLPEMLEKEYNDRVKYKKLMIQAQQEYQRTKNKKLLNDIAKYHIIQFSKKISLNSTYMRLVINILDTMITERQRQ